MTSAFDSTQRFSNRVDNYVRYRPGYPAQLVTIVREVLQLVPDAQLADIGSGTGLSTLPFLEQGHTVFGVEPNREMRAAGEALLAGFAKFHSVDGTAEATTLADASLDGLLAGQAFHWFDVEKCRSEFARILKPGAGIALIWNSRRTASTPFLREYEALLHTFGTDYAQVQHTTIDAARLATFFAPGTMQRVALYNEQRFDLAGVTGRLLSSSYAPAAGDPRHEPMLARLREIFAAYQDQGEIVFQYDTEIYAGRV